MCKIIFVPFSFFVYSYKLPHPLHCSFVHQIISKSLNNSATDEEELMLLAKEFHLWGFSMINKSSVGLISTKFFCFKSFFGIDWLMCARLWLLLFPQLCDEHYNACSTKTKGLLWMIMFLRLYITEEVLSSNVGGVDKKCVWLLNGLVPYLQIGSKVVW